MTFEEEVAQEMSNHLLPEGTDGRWAKLVSERIVRERRAWVALINKMDPYIDGCDWDEHIENSDEVTELRALGLWPKKGS